MNKFFNFGIDTYPTLLLLVHQVLYILYLFINLYTLILVATLSQVGNTYIHTYSTHNDNKYKLILVPQYQYRH